MKKALSLFLAILMIFGVLSLAGCGEKETLKFGTGIYSYISESKNADGETNGSCQGVVNVASVLLDKEGKIVKCVLDVADNKVDFTSTGEAVTAEEFKTKYELGNEYGMKAYGGAEKEWFEQVDAFIGIVEGKTLDEVKKLLAGDNKGTEEVVNAGCTIVINDFIKVIELAVNNATQTEATEDDDLKIGIYSSQSSDINASADKAGSNGFETAVAASVLDKEKKVKATFIDSIAIISNFDVNGVTTTKTGDMRSKKQIGDNYGMKKYGNASMEWYEQVNVLESLCVGKTSSEITALAKSSGKGTEEVANAGCTIIIKDIIKAAALSAK